MVLFKSKNNTYSEPLVKIYKVYIYLESFLFFMDFFLLVHGKTILWISSLIVHHSSKKDVFFNKFVMR